jgi:hypothetical protein
LQFLGDLFEVPHRATQPVQLRDDQGVPVPNVLEHLVKSRPPGKDTGSMFNEDFLAAGRFENVRLSFRVLFPVNRSDKWRRFRSASPKMR